MVINIQVHGMSKLQNKIKNLAEKLENLQPFFNSVGEYMKRRTIKECFDKEQSPNGEKWKPLKEATLKRRRNKSSHKILQDMGELRRSIQYKSSKNDVVIGSKLKYARTHQFGRGKIPARPYLGVTQSDKQHITNMFAIYLRRKTNV